ncbi:hypothetical protein MPOCJGCO_0068 [Methylobacterium trifolii]|uniref:Uncharacterized protein n=1 Tax=Methylobacterium trifolii TaxID=1003092 RepID=A0ABQ4TTD2_9HYPH|nr:hypothetical protein MPOCJGCO_0068 [Methylobacterium trifolii]
MRKILIAFLLPKVVSWLRRRYGGQQHQRGRSF